VEIVFAVCGLMISKSLLHMVLIVTLSRSAA
jgi:hypothetical protein